LGHSGSLISGAGNGWAATGGHSNVTKRQTMGKPGCLETVNTPASISCRPDRGSDANAEAR